MLSIRENRGIGRRLEADVAEIEGTPSKQLPDCAVERDTRELSIEQVGIAGLSYPLTVWTRRGEPQHTVGTLELGVGLPSHFKGTHMSRFVEVLNRHRGELSLRTVPRLLIDVQRHLEADDAFINVSFPYFLEREAPVSKAKSLMEYRCRFEAKKSGDKVEFTLVVEVPVTTLCPCSKSISKYGAHSQRSFVEVAVRFDGMVWIEQIVDAVEGCASAPLYALLKRADEKWVTEHAYENPRFVEDLVREVVIAVRALDGVSWLRVRAENVESIHKHQAYAVITLPDESPSEEASALPAEEEAPPFGDWMRRQRVARGESQGALAEAIGVSPSIVSRVERGGRQLSESSLARLAIHWGMEPAKLQLRAGALSKELLAHIQRNPESFLAWARR